MTWLKAISAVAALVLALGTTQAVAKGPKGNGFAKKQKWSEPRGWRQGKKRGWRKSRRPPGWSRGRKRGWRGQRMPRGLSIRF